MHMSPFQKRIQYPAQRKIRTKIWKYITEHKENEDMRMNERKKTVYIHLKVQRKQEEQILGKWFQRRLHSKRS